MRLLPSASVLVLAAGCVNSFDGSRIEMLLRSGVQIPGDTNPGNGKPPSDTHYEMYVFKDKSAFHIYDFDVKPVVNTNDPCFIEPRSSKFPGLHTTMFGRKTKEFVLAESGGSPTPDEAGEIAIAEKRVANLDALQNQVKAVVDHEPGLTDKMVADFMATVPPASDMSDAANATRLSMCEGFFKQHPLYYVGNDQVFILPINGKLLGMVEGQDPRNLAFLGGVGFDVPWDMPKFDTMQINWNWNDPADPRAAAYSPSKIGFYYMSGAPVEKERGVINVPMTNKDYASISAEAAIFNDLSSDNVQF